MFVWGIKRQNIFKVSSVSEREEWNTNFLAAIAIEDGYKLGKDGGFGKDGGSKVRTVIMCNQKWRTSTVDECNRQRLTDPAQKYPCNGKAFISYREERMYIKVSHDSHHGILLARDISDSTSMMRIIELYVQGLRPFQIVTVLRSEGSNLGLYDTVSSIWLRSIPAEFRRHEDRCISAGQFVEGSDEMELLCNQNMPYGLGILSALGK